MRQQAGLAIKLRDSLPPARPLPPKHSISSPNRPSSWRGPNDETPKPMADRSFKPQRMSKYGEAGAEQRKESSPTCKRDRFEQMNSASKSL